MRAPWTSVVAFAAALAAAPGHAHAQPAAAPRFPVAVRLVLSPDTLGAHHVHRASRPIAPPNPSTKVPVGAQAREAFAAAAARLFDAGAGDARAEVVVTLASSAVELDREGWFAAVEHEVALRDVAAPAPAEIARWRVRGEGRILGPGETAVHAAFRRAAEYAARTFAAEAEAEPAVREWLAGRGLAPRPGAGPTTAPPRLAPTPPVVVRARSRELLFVDLGGSAVAAEGGALNGAFSLRAGWSGRLVLVQLALDHWPATFVANPPQAWGSGDGSADAYALGVDVGVQRRLGSRFELQAGAGAGVLRATASARYVPLSAPDTWSQSSGTGSALAASVFAGARLNAVLPRTAIRYRVGVEARRHFGASLDLPDMGRALQLAELSAGVFLGVELPWGTRRVERVAATARQ